MGAACLVVCAGGDGLLSLQRLVRKGECLVLLLSALPTDCMLPCTLGRLPYSLLAGLG